MRFSLSGAMIPRQVRRMFEQREEPRLEPQVDRATLCWRGKIDTVRVGNVSPSGMMVWFDGLLHIGERVAVQMLDHEPRTGQVRWVRDGRVGINFTGPCQ